MNEAERYLKSFLQDLEDEVNHMRDALLNYEGRCYQLKVDIKRVEFAIEQGKKALVKMKEV